MLALALLALLTQTPQHRLFLQPNLPRGGIEAALFEFAPASGAGMTAACACTTPTGAKGEALTFTRASSGTCLKAGTTTSIASGDLVTCSTDQSRVRPQGDDGTGVLGLFEEEARTNLMLRSEAFDNASWTKSAGVTVAANSASCPLAPDGTQTADLVTFGGLSDTGIYQGATVVAANKASHSVFLARKTGGAACSLAVTDAFTVVPDTVVAVPASGWTRGINNNLAIGGVTAGLYLREVTAGDCTDACVWGGSTENNAFASSYIATAGATVTRARDITYVTLPSPVDTGNGIYSSAATLSVGSLSTSNWQVYLLQNAGLTLYHGLYNAGAGNLRCESYNATAIAATHARQGAFTSKRIGCFNDGSNEQGIYDGTAFSTPAAGVRIASTAVTKMYLGSDSTAGFEINGVISRVCLDPNPARCR